MKKIICPTDFTSTGNNAIEYSAKLAQKINAELELLNIHLLSPLDPMVTLMNTEENVSLKTKTLIKTCEEITNIYNVTCSSNVETTNKSMETSVGTEALENNLIVMGTNGTGDIYQYFFGTNTYHVIKKSKCPVLMIPEGVVYGDLKKIVFAWDYTKNNEASFIQLKNLVKIYNSEIIFVHVSDLKTKIGDDLFIDLKDKVLEHFGNEAKISFDQIYLKDDETITEKIDSYTIKVNADLLAVTYYDRGTFLNLFHGAIIKDFSEIAEYPLLVLHV